ncbi:MAG TPA: ribonuclease P protein component [Pirellulales bacterium]|nr:ribonuclease P protein component [Pirellulales bacterium]
MRTGFAFPPECRIRRGADFQRAYRRRCVASNELIVVHGCENGLDHPRLGLSVSRKVGGAVVRNRWKRLLREAFRLSRHELPRGVDLVIVPRKDVEPELTRLLASLSDLARQVERKLRRGRR